VVPVWAVVSKVVQKRYILTVLSGLSLYFVRLISVVMNDGLEPIWMLAVLPDDI